VAPNHDEPNVVGILPPQVVTPANIVELKREVDGLDEFLRQAAIRRSGVGLALPKTGYLLNELVMANDLNLLEPKDREALLRLLNHIKDKAPVIHISFATDPSTAFMAKIVKWFRDNVHPQTLIQIGLQPSIAAGCVIRSTNKVFDLSLRKSFEEKQDVLIDRLNRGVAQ
jgi:hypothetical protein